MTTRADLLPVPLPILLVGGGRMGEAILSGVLGAQIARSDDIIVAEPDETRRVQIADSFGVRVVPDAATVAHESALVVVAVKPQVVDEVLGVLGAALPGPIPVVSIAAGVPTARLEQLLPPGAPVVRVMPNTPAMIGQGVSALSAGTDADADAIDVATQLFAALGDVVVVEETLQDAVTGVSGSGPAYVALFVAALASAGEGHGLAPETAYALALQTVRGTAELLARTGQTPADLVEAVSSPGGTTVAAREVLDRDGFSDAVGSAVAAAVARARELGAS